MTLDEVIKSTDEMIHFSDINHYCDFTFWILYIQTTQLQEIYHLCFILCGLYIVN